MLSARLLEALRAYWPFYRPRLWLFPAHGGDRPMHPTSLHRAYQAAKRRRDYQARGIHGSVTPLPRTSWEAGIDVYTIQRLLGHGEGHSELT